MKTDNRINQLISMAYSTNSTARLLAITDQILELDPNNPDALLLKAIHTKRNDKKIELLKHSLESLNSPDNLNYNDREYLLFQVNEGLALIYFMTEDYHESFRYCIEAKKLLELHEEFEEMKDEDGYGYFRTIYYRVMIELQEWQKILAESMRDEEHNTSWAYSRLIAAFMLSSGEHGHIYANMFCDLLRISPEVPFYMLGYYDEPDDDAGLNSDDDFNFALMFYDTLTISEEFRNWFNRGVILFGLLTNRFDAREHDYMIDALDVLGGYDEYEAMTAKILTHDDETVIEAMSANRCLE